MHVYKLSGKICDEPETLQQLSRARPNIVVHGGGIQLDQALHAFGEPERIDGRRVTSQHAASIAARTLDAVGEQLAHALSAQGLKTRHVASSQALLQAQVMKPELGRVGVPTHASWKPVAETAVVTPVGWDPSGPLNVNADEGAVAISAAAKASMLHFLSDVPGVLDQHGQPLRSMTRREVSASLRAKHVYGGMIPKLQSALMAVNMGISSVRIGKWNEYTEVVP